MGSGVWSTANYFAAATARKARGVSTFAHHDEVMRSGHLRAHQTLDPQGLLVRESRDSTEHPESNAIIVSLDVTGSMDRVVRGIHRDLPHLHELLLGHKYIPHPQILFGAVGDATCDAVPLQVGQFESDNRMDQNIENMVLEGGGGGQKTESYELMLYVAARHTAIDCFEKRGRKGYLFIIGDEMAYDTIRRAHIYRLIGRDPQTDIPLRTIIAEAQEKYHVYFIIPGGAAHGDDRDVLNFWLSHLGDENVLRLESPDDTSECIAMAIGVREGVVQPGQLQQQLASRGKPEGVIQRIMHSLRGLFGGADPSPDRTSGSRRL